MKNFEKELENLAMYIQSYEDTSLNDGEALNELLQKINVTLFYLEKERANFKKQYEMRIFELTTDKKMTVARAVNFAEVEVPELYLMRRIMDRASNCCEAIRTHISFIKYEKRNS